MEVVTRDGEMERWRERRVDLVAALDSSSASTEVTGANRWGFESA
jgi:hypothetical protein